jgi:DNA repair exonuclease SbcCD ATPase subunit
MRITRLRLSDFKTHEELEIEPAAGLTIVRGPNEAGKSTIQQAIELALFRKADANREDIRQAWTWGSSEPPSVELDFVVEGTSASLRKRFGGTRAEAELTVGGQTIHDYALISDELADLTGVPTEAFYRATASVGHSQLDAVGGDEPAIGDRLQQAISGADRGTAKAKKKLEAAVRRYRTEGHKNPGLLKVAREHIATLEGDLAEGEAALARLEADRAQWVEANERREELEIKLTRQQADLAEAQRAQALAAKRDAAQDRYSRLKRATELTETQGEVQRELPTSLPLAQLRTAVSRAQSLEFELSELEAEIDTAVEAAEAEGPDLVPPRPMRWLVAAALLVLVGWLAMFLLRASGFMGVAVVAAIAVGVLVTLLQAFRQARKRRIYGLTMQLAETQMNARQEHARARQETYRRVRRELDGTLEALGAADVRGAESILASTEKQTERLAQIEGELRGLGFDEGNIRRLEEARDQAANEAEQAAHALAAMGSLVHDPERALQSAQRQVALTSPARDAARSEADQAQGRVDANQVDAELVAGLAERLAAAGDHHAELERRMLVYQGTLAAIAAAEAATLKTAARYLEEHMGPTIEAVTDGRYDDIEVDEQSLAFKVRAPETGEFVEVEQLSQGTADQLFLAARLGLVRLVTLGRLPPLILDDPFVTFDAARGERALRMVKRMAHEHGFQVLYLTCSDRFDKLADKLVVLPGPSADRVLAHPRRTAALDEEAIAPVPDADEAPAPDQPQPTLRFAPDPRPNPDPVAPRHGEPEEVLSQPLFGQPVEQGSLAAARLARSRAARAAHEAEADPLESLRRAAQDAGEAERDTGVADPFHLADDDEGGGAV